MSEVKITEENAQRLAEIDEREKAATKGPWRAAYPTQSRDRVILIVSKNDQAVACIYADSERAEANAEFIANARQDIPWLVEMVERLNADLEVEHGYCESLSIRCEPKQLKMANILAKESANKMGNNSAND